jgi:ABC-2 type transport system permease protein
MVPLIALVRKEFIQFFRSRPLVILIIWVIAVEIAICAYSITWDVTHIRLAIRDLDGSPISRGLVARFSATDYFDAAYWPRSGSELDDLLETGRATVGLVIPPDLARDLGQGLPASVHSSSTGPTPTRRSSRSGTPPGSSRGTLASWRSGGCAP